MEGPSRKRVLLLLRGFPSCCARRGARGCGVKFGEAGRKSVDFLQRQAQAHPEAARSVSLKKDSALCPQSCASYYGVTEPPEPTMASQKATPVLHAGTVTVPELFACDVADVDPSPTTALMISLPRVSFPLQAVPIVM